MKLGIMPDGRRGRGCNRPCVLIMGIHASTKKNSNGLQGNSHGSQTGPEPAETGTGHAGVPEGPLGDTLMAKTTFKVMAPHAKYRYGAGLDVHKDYVTACVAVQREAAVEKVAVQEFKQSPVGLEDLCRFLGKYLLEIVVMEATGVYTPPVKASLDAHAGWGMMKPAIVVINPSLIRKFPGEPHQDNRDALDLAALGLRGMARGSFIPAGQARELRAITREMDFVTRDCTRAKNRIKRVLAEWGLPLPKLKLDAEWALNLFRAIDWAKGDFGRALEGIMSGAFKVPTTSKRTIASRAPLYAPYASVKLPEAACVVLRAYLLTLSFHGTMITRLNDEVERLVRAAPAVERALGQLSAVDGLSQITVAGILAEMGSVHRFPTMRKFLQYSGCAPADYDSGQTHRPGHLSKRVNPFLKRRFIWVGKALCHNVKTDSDLKEYARAQLNLHWGKKERKLAWANVGIKVARVVYTLLKTGRAYDPFYESKDHSEHPEAGVLQDGTSREQAPITAEVPPEDTLAPVVFRTLRKRTRQFARYVEGVLKGDSSDWYGSLAKYFDQLALGAKLASKASKVPS